MTVRLKEGHASQVEWGGKWRRGDCYENGDYLGAQLVAGNQMKC
jgi:hypothetical protein